MTIIVVVVFLGNPAFSSSVLLGFLVHLHFWAKLNKKPMPTLLHVIMNLTKNFSPRLPSWLKTLYANCLLRSKGEHLFVDNNLSKVIHF